WTSTRARSYSGNVEGARTSCLRGMRTLPTSRQFLTDVGGNVPSLSSGMGILFWRAQTTSLPIFTPFIRSFSQLSHAEASPFALTFGRLL
uniref:Uncharacterized protein n=1 Tax=Aegilops tauschii subsp. strangulata TaxID=200361 RepID=A0A453J5N1_AEGTS